MGGRTGSKNLSLHDQPGRSASNAVQVGKKQISTSNSGSGVTAN
jgi:hypothetical protein